MQESARPTDFDRMLREDYLVLSERARKMWEQSSPLGVRNFLFVLLGACQRGDIERLPKCHTLSFLDGEFAPERLILLDPEKEELHVVISWNVARKGLRAKAFEEASIISLDTPTPTVLAKKVPDAQDEESRGKVQILYPLQDGKHAFLDASGKSITLIVRGHPISLSGKDARAFIKKLCMEREQRRSLLEICVAGIFVLFCSVLFPCGFGRAMVALGRYGHALLLLIGTCLLWDLLIPRYRIGLRMSYERLFAPMRFETYRYGKRYAPWQTILLTVIFFVLSVGILFFFSFFHFPLAVP